jgi:hypothetical protein
MATRRRAVRGLPHPPPATPAAEEPSGLPEEPPAPRSRREAVDGRPGVGEGRIAPARTAHRNPHTFRLYDELFAELTRLLRELEDVGVKSDRTELLHALLYYDLPATGEAAEKLIRRWRKVQAGA